MADMHYTHDGGHAGYSAPEGYYTPDAEVSQPASNALRNLTNLTGAVVSLALVAGVAVWGYKLVVRDVSGIPVVRAAESAMRVRPENPGGQLARNTGLAVNEVAGAGEASGPVDQVTLAPRPTELTSEDQPMKSKMVAPVQQPAPLDVAASLDQPATTLTAEPVSLDVAAVLADGSVDDLVNQLTAGVPTIEADAATQTIAPTQASFTPPIVPDVSGPGPAQSRRPQLRPASAPAVVVPASAPAAIETKDIDSSALPSGTRLVQLGAYKSEEIARSEWDKKFARYGEYLEGKSRVVQEAQSGGRTFYRLRAHGFADLSDARRFCSALVAEGAECIPVVTR